MNELLYKKNLLALSSIDPQLSFEICSIKPSKKIETVSSRDGNIIPVIKNGKTNIQLHSLFNPRLEAEKLYESEMKGKNSGFIIVYGIGGGYHIAPYIKDQSVENILIIDTDKKYFRKIIENIDLTEIFASRKVNLLIDPDYSSLENTLTEKYLPSVYGNLDIVKLRNRTNSEVVFFEAITKNINIVLNKISDDFTSQAFFGKRWFKNIINNLKYAEGVQILPHIKNKAAIIGAGPSLETQIGHLEKNTEETLILSSDTAAQYLISKNIIPDYIISIDCQHITYNHLIGCPSRNIPVIMDLGSPVFLSRFFNERIYFTSANPLSRYIASKWRYFQYIDTSGGNVGFSSIAVAAAIGIQDITLYGIDYSFTDFKPYARDTFLYKYFLNNQNMLSSSENSVYSFARRGDIRETETKGVFSNSRMDNYYNSLISFIRRNNISVKSAPGSPRVIEHVSGVRDEASQYNLFASGRALMPWKMFLNDYYNALAALPEPFSPFNKYYGNLSRTEQELWTTIFPVCAASRKEHKEEHFGAGEILLKTRTWCLNQIEKTLRQK